MVRISSVEAAGEHRLVDLLAHPEGATHQHADRRDDPPALLLARTSWRRCGSCARGTCRSPCAGPGRCSDTSSPARGRRRWARAGPAATSGCRPTSSSGSAGSPATRTRRRAGRRSPAAIEAVACAPSDRRGRAGCETARRWPTKKIDGRMTMPLNSPMPSQTRLTNRPMSIDETHAADEHERVEREQDRPVARERGGDDQRDERRAAWTRGSRRCRKPSLRAFSSEKTACSMLAADAGQRLLDEARLQPLAVRLRGGSGSLLRAVIVRRFSSQAARRA